MGRVMRAVGQPSKIWVWGAVAALTIGMVGMGGPATAAPPKTNSAPAATASASEPVDDGVTITYTINRAAKTGIPGITCTLDTPPVPIVDCGTSTASTKKLTTYTLHLTGLEDGLHTFVVTFNLSDGGTASATAQFTIDTISPEEACAAQHGYLVTYRELVYWVCWPQETYVLGAGAVDALAPYCQGIAQWAFASGGATVVACRRS